jgi:ubiquinone/menaquinone biosynthesis C-methylase UbiE
VGFYEEQVLPRLTDKLCGNAGMERWRRRAVEGLEGTVLELGSGSGPNFHLYPEAVSHVHAVEPSAVARQLAQRRPERSGLRVDYVDLRDGQDLPLEDASCDGALSTFVLCTIPDVSRTLSELRRVLRPGGRFNFLEHGRAPDPGVLRWQQRIEPVQRRCAGGCHLTRDVRWLVSEAGFRFDRIESRYAKGPKPWTWFTLGSAVNPG